MKKNVGNITLIIIIIAAFFYTETKAQNFNDALRLSEPGLGFNARALGMGNAYVGISDDYSATFFNPAGLGLVKKMEIAGGLNYNKYNNDALFFGSSTDYSNSSTKLDQLSFTFPFPTIRGSMVFSIGYSKIKDFNQAVSFDGFNSTNTSMIRDLALSNDDVAYDLGLSYPVYDDQGNYLYDDTNIMGNLQQSGTILSKGRLGKWSFAGAVEISKDVFIGGSFNILSGGFNRSREYYEEDVNNVYQGLVDPDDNRTSNFQRFYFNDVIDWDISGWDFNVGLLYQFAGMGRWGVSMKFPTSYNIREIYLVNGSSDFANGQGFDLDTYESEIEYSISSPFEFSSGISYNFRPLIISGSVTFIDYTQMEFDNDGDLDFQSIYQNNRDIKDLFRSVINWKLGAELIVPSTNLRLRGGFMMDPSAYDGDPSERDKKYLTGGIGFLSDEAFSFDLAYVYGWWKDIGDNYGTNVSRFNQDIKFHNLIFTVSHRF